MPESFEVNKKKHKSGLCEAVGDVCSPMVEIKWRPEKQIIDNLPIIKAIEEIKSIVEEYKVKDASDIRIVFAFD